MPLFSSRFHPSAKPLCLYPLTPLPALLSPPPHGFFFQSSWVLYDPFALLGLVRMHRTIKGNSRQLRGQTSQVISRERLAGGVLYLLPGMLIDTAQGAADCLFFFGEDHLESYNKLSFWEEQRQ